MMKKMMSFLILAFSVSSIANAELKVNQTFTSQYQQEFWIGAHSDFAQDFLNANLKAYSCVGGILNNNIVKKSQLKFFGPDVPGEVEFNYKVVCNNSDLTDVQFNFSVAGYDEDYSYLSVKIVARSGTEIKTACVYAQGAKLKKCPKELTDYYAKSPEWSVSK